MLPLLTYPNLLALLPNTPTEAACAITGLALGAIATRLTTLHNAKH